MKSSTFALFYRSPSSHSPASLPTTYSIRSHASLNRCLDGDVVAIKPLPPSEKEVEWAKGRGDGQEPYNCGEVVRILVQLLCVRLFECLAELLSSLSYISCLPALVTNTCACPALQYFDMLF